MTFEELLYKVTDEPCFTTWLLLSGEAVPRDIQRQLSRWQKSGKILQLRRGIYVLAPPYRKVVPHPFLIANRLVNGSYVSLQSALAFYDMIPEHVPVTTSVTTLRPGSWPTPVGFFSFRHIKRTLFHSYARLHFSDGQEAVVATREKALCDLVYLVPQAESPEFLSELRLQNLQDLDPEELKRTVRLFNSPKLARALGPLLELREAEAREYAEG